MSVDPRFERFVLARPRLVVEAVPTNLLDHVRALSNAPGSAGYLARVVARAAIEDRLDGTRPLGETLTALCLLPDPWLAT
jgi:hypothetical protein